MKNLLNELIKNEIKMWRQKQDFKGPKLDVYESETDDYVLGDEDTLKLSKKYNPKIVEPDVAQKVSDYFKTLVNIKKKKR